MSKTREQVICLCNPQCAEISKCDNWKCVCGNMVGLEGFYACDEHGREVEPTPELWTSDLNVCGRCSRVFDQITGQRYYTTEDVAAGYAEREGVQ